VFRRLTALDALTLPLEATGRQHTIDITTIGAQSGTPRRIEIWFHHLLGRWYLSGPPGPRGWVANLTKQPDFVVHLKHGIRADLPATARRITALAERQQVFSEMLKVYNLPSNPARIQQPVVLGDLVPAAPLFEFTVALP
jgi:hypothetical protein